MTLVVLSRRTGVERGSVGGTSRLRVRQLGSDIDGVQVATNTVLLRPGTDYVLFVEPFTFGDGRDTGQWAIVGQDIGDYELRGDELVRPASSSVPSDARPDSVPARLTLQQLRDELARS